MGWGVRGTGKHAPETGKTGTMYKSARFDKEAHIPRGRRIVGGLFMM